MISLSYFVEEYVIMFFFIKNSSENDKPWSHQKSVKSFEN